MGQSSREPRKIVIGGNQNAWGDAFFMKHNAELQGSGFTVHPGITICEEVPHLEMYYVVERSGVDRSIGRCLRTILERFPGEKAVSREPGQDLWDPIVNKDATRVYCADRHSGKARYSSSKKIFLEEFEKKNEPVWIAKETLRWTSGLAKSQLS